MVRKYIAQPLRPHFLDHTQEPLTQIAQLRFKLSALVAYDIRQ